ncbi:MAG: hypothetical protein KUG77_07320, partial [Nannocystaceae bacterium]|nr:hypothetical protein [Nannocystaceae bacterium]
MFGSALRALALAGFATAITSCSIAHAEEADHLVAELEVADPPVHRPMGATIPFSAHPRLNLSAVWWSAPRKESLKRLADRWGADDDE